MPRPVSTGTTPVRTIRVSDDLWAACQAAAKARGTYASTLIVEFVKTLAEPKDIVNTSDTFRTLFTDIHTAWGRKLAPRNRNGRGKAVPLIPVNQRPRPPMRPRPSVDKATCPHENTKTITSMGTFCKNCGEKVA